MAGGIKFNGNSLQTFDGNTGILTQTIDHRSTPDKTMAVSPLAHSNRSVITSIFYQSRKISVTGKLVGSSIADLDAREDAFRALFIGQDQNLDIDYGTGVRRYIATGQTIKVIRLDGLLDCTFQIDFICTDPYGYDTSASTLINDSAITSGTYAPALTVAGTAPYQRPVITLTYTALTGNTGQQTVTISNQATGQTISITRAWSVNDVVIIDCYNKTVTVNNTPVPFSGAFPEFKAGAGAFGYSDQFTARTFNFNVTNINAYL